MTTRRQFVRGLGVAGAAVAVSCHRPSESDEVEVTPAEDLMREHGVLRRIMYLYDETAVRLVGGAAVPLDALGRAAALVRRFVEDYHERMEELFVFPRFEAAGTHTELTAVLRRQHDLGRSLTTQIRVLSSTPLGPPERTKLVVALRTFNHMYRAHAAREDTVLFPALRPLIGAKDYAALGDELEDQEHDLLGASGFEGAVEEVAALERAYGVDDLAKL